MSSVKVVVDLTSDGVIPVQPSGLDLSPELGAPKRPPSDEVQELGAPKRARMDDPVPAADSNSGWQPFYLLRADDTPHNILPTHLQMKDIFDEDPSGRNPIKHVHIFNFLINPRDLYDRWLFKFSSSDNQVPVDVYQDPVRMKDLLGSRRASSLIHAPNWTWTAIAVGMPREYHPDEFRGCHHSKFFIIFYADGVRLVIHSTNLRQADLTGLCQGAFVQDFPLKAATGVSKVSTFESHLVAYIHDYKSDQILNSESVKLASDVRLLALEARLGLYDFSAAEVELVSSIPGSHSSQALTRYGQLRMRELLRSHGPANPKPEATINMQVSSISSLGTDESFLHDLTLSLRAPLSYPDPAPASTLASTSTLAPALRNAAFPHDLRIYWPSCETARNSVDGYSASACLPCHSKNIRNVYSRPYDYYPLFKYSLRQWINVTGDRKVPHIKSFYRGYTDESTGMTELYWLYIGSHNISQAAWGNLANKGKTLTIKSYELGVLFLPSKFKTNRRLFSCTPRNALLGTRGGLSLSDESVRVSVNVGGNKAGYASTSGGGSFSASASVSAPVPGPGLGAARPKSRFIVSHLPSPAPVHGPGPGPGPAPQGSSSSSTTHSSSGSSSGAGSSSYSYSTSSTTITTSNTSTTSSSSAAVAATIHFPLPHLMNAPLFDWQQGLLGNYAHRPWAKDLRLVLPDSRGQMKEMQKDEVSFDF